MPPWQGRGLALALWKTKIWVSARLWRAWFESPAAPSPALRLRPAETSLLEPTRPHSQSRQGSRDDPERTTFLVGH